MSAKQMLKWLNDGQSEVTAPNREPSRFRNTLRSGEAFDLLGDERRDHPLSCHWRPVAADAYGDLDLPQLRSSIAAIARRQIITEACVTGRADPDTWVSYSRRREFYAARQGRYWPITLSYDTVVPVVDQLAAHGLLDHEKIRRQSR